MRKNTNTILSFIIGTRPTPVSIFFFFNDPPPTEISPLPLYDALPISRITATCRDRMAVATKFRLICRICSPNPGMTLSATASVASGVTSRGAGPVPPVVSTRRSEEHTSELQSQSNLVCRLLLVKKIVRHCEHADDDVLVVHDLLEVVVGANLERRPVAQRLSHRPRDDAVARHSPQPSIGDHVHA